ncbi:MAG: ribosome small subunit-dependent GTPase A [Firmicutes bacterium]|nr:ribosome small subunit-dependent GTPase A [Bacillota bacterium]
MPKGVILKGVGGFYSVLIDGEDEVVVCRLRGRLRLGERRVLPGDRVEVSLEDGEEGVVEEILPRHSEMIRPPVANVDQVVVVQSVAQPDPSPTLIDRLVVLAEDSHLGVILVFNKVDQGLTDEARRLVDIYWSIGYPVLLTSAKSKEGVEELTDALVGKISMLAGLSGVGKSSVINAILPGANLTTGSVSERLGRGRHTTRHVELLPLPKGGLLADTPGFSQLQLPEMERARLQELFIEFGKYAPQCRFSGCLHYKEPDCAVREAVAQHHIAESRYANYVTLLEELIEYEENRY